MKKALEDVKQNRFAEAVAKLKDTPQAENERGMLQQAAADVNEGIKEAVEAAHQDPKKPNRTLEDAANKAKANQLENAAKQADKAGQTRQAGC